MHVLSDMSPKRLMRNENRRRIVKYIRDNPRKTAGEVSRDLKVSYKTAERNLLLLYDAGIVVAKNEHADRRYRMGGFWEKRVDELLNYK